MHMAMTLIALVAGLVLSLAVALIAEEVIFGQVIRMFFFHKPGIEAAGTQLLQRNE